MIERSFQYLSCTVGFVSKYVLGQGHYILGCHHCNCAPRGVSRLVLLFSVLFSASKFLFLLAFIDATMS